MKGIIGKKVGMIHLFDVQGRVYPATVIHCEKNHILAVRSSEKNGYKAVQVGYEQIPEKKLNKAQLTYQKKNQADGAYRIVREIRDMDGQVGQKIAVNQFEVGEYVDVQARTRGRGFTGAIARWNFKIGPLGHGAGYPHRYQGSIAMGRGGSQAQRVRKGQKMSGHYGNELVTVQNLGILQVNENDDLLIVLGAIPGPTNGVVFVKQSLRKMNKKMPKIDLLNKTNIEKVHQQNESLQDKEALHEQATEQAKVEEKQVKVETKGETK